MTTKASNLIRWAGLSAMLAGILFVVVGLTHPPNVPSSATTSVWAIVHAVMIAVSFLGLLGLAGIQARQAEEAGWLGLVGYLLLSLWLFIVTGYTFFEVLVLPQLATDAPAFTAGFLGMFTGTASQTNLGALPALWQVTGVLYLLGGLLFGLATLRAGVLPRWAGGLLAGGAVSSLAFALLPHEVEPLATVPVGLGLAWLGYALWSERRDQVSAPVVLEPRAVAAVTASP